VLEYYLKYCVYLKGLPVESLTQEEQDFMRTMAEVDAWYEAEIDRSKFKEKQTIVHNLLRLRRLPKILSQPLN
jgi:antitoxin component of RelBE/YafQ-DinJ toxin-antitoxin module